MFRTVLLAYDGSPEGALALREGALLAKACGAQVQAGRRPWRCSPDRSLTHSACPCRRRRTC